MDRDDRVIWPRLLKALILEGLWSTLALRQMGMLARHLAWSTSATVWTLIFGRAPPAGGRQTCVKPVQPCSSFSSPGFPDKEGLYLETGEGNQGARLQTDCTHSIAHLPQGQPPRLLGSCCLCLSVFLRPSGKFKLGQPSRGLKGRAVVPCFGVPYTCGIWGSEIFMWPLQKQATLKVTS